MKKLITITLTLTLLCLFSFSTISCDIFPLEKGTDGLEYYLLPDGSYGVSAGTAKHLQDITIPSKHNGKSYNYIS